MSYRFIRSSLLFMILGGTLGFSGISFTQQPLLCLWILLIVALIELNGGTK